MIVPDCYVWQGSHGQRPVQKHSQSKAYRKSKLTTVMWHLWGASRVTVDTLLVSIKVPNKVKSDRLRYTEGRARTLGPAPGLPGHSLPTPPGPALRVP